MRSFIDFVASCDFEAPTAMMASRALPSFLSSVRRNHVDGLSEEALRLWVADMLLAGLKAKTAARYLGTVHSSYKEWMALTEAADDLFRAVVREVAGLKCQDAGFAGENLRHLPALLKTDEKSAGFVTAGVFMFLLYDVRASMNDVICLRHKGYDSECAQLTEIVEKMPRAAQAEYAFPLRQSRKRLTQISRELTSDMRKLLAEAGLRFGTSFSRGDITAMWIEAAWRSGVTVKEIRSMVGSIPESHDFLRLIAPDSIGEDERERIICRVADHINDRTRRWFVMKLRSGVKPDDIDGKLRRSCPALLGDLRFYYPTRQVMRKEGKKKWFDEVPYLPDILFFRTYRDKIGRIFRHIGDQAWAFRTANSPDSPYTSIPVSEMTKFQRHVGLFTPDIEMRLVSAEPAAGVGDSVSVVGGDLYEGLEGEVLSVRRENGRLIYSLRLTQSKYIRWEGVEVEDCFVEPLHRIGD